MEEENRAKKDQEKWAYLADLDKQRYEKLNKKLYDETKKREEILVIKKEEEVLKQNSEIKAAHDKMYHQYLHESYLATVNMHQDKKKEDHLKVKEDERRKLLKI